MGKRSHRPRKLTHSQILSRGLKANDIALRLRVPVRYFETKRDGLSMNAMRPPNHRSVLELKCPALQHLRQPIEINRNQRRRLLDQQCLRRIDYVVRRKSI